MRIGVFATAALLIGGCQQKQTAIEKMRRAATRRLPGRQIGKPARGVRTATRMIMAHMRIMRIRSLPPRRGSIENGVRGIDVIARRDEFVPSRIVVHEGERVRLDITSQDVPRGIGIAAFDINKKLPPNQTVAVTFVADSIGAFHFHCSVYRGPGHERMHGELVVLDQ
jgi:cytochrome c oxidase subunit 2